MIQRHRAPFLWGTVLGCLILCFSLASPLALAQQATGTVNVVVVDPSGGVIAGAHLKLVDIVTNTTREATTENVGSYTFVNLNIGTYKLTVTQKGFETQIHTVIVQAGRITDVNSQLKVGGSQEVVEVVGTSAPLVETSSSATNMTIDVKQIEDLPLGGRNIAQLSRLAAGYNGTWNGLPTMAQGSSMDGIMAVSGRWKYSSGADAAAVTPRLETIGEMTVSTDQLDMNNGFGTTNMQITYITRRGTNQFHGRVYEDHRNAALNAGPWNGSAKPGLILNEFGGSVGGPIIKDKVFFFGSFSMSKQPGGVAGQNVYFTQPAQAGNFTFYGVNGEGGAAGSTRSINLFNVIQSYNTAHGTNFPTTINASVQSRLAAINGMVQKGSLISGIGDDPLNTSGVQWNQANTTTYYYPTIRLDYDISQKLRLNMAYNETKYSAPGVNLGWFPADGRGAGNSSDNMTIALGLEWTISPTLINQFRAGYLYTAAWYGTGGSQAFREPGGSETFWNYGGYEMSGQVYNLPNSRMQPVISLSDNVTWVKGRHTLTFGFNAWRDQNKYWDPPEGYDLVSLGLATGDPVLQAFTEQALTVGGYQPTSSELANAQQIYSILTGRVNSVTGRKAYDPKTGVYSTGVAYSTLNELMKAWGLSFQDSFKVKSNLTLNYGLRWDFMGENRDLTGKYHSMTPADVFGPSGEWNLFNPGVYKPNGTFDPLLQVRPHAYDSWKITPQPAIGIAWSPRSDGNMLEKLMGGSKTVVRAGYSLRRFTEPQQFVWDMVSAYAAGFYQPFYSYPDFSGSAGSYTPGSVSLDASGVPTPYPSIVKQPPVYTDTIHLADSTYGDVYFGGIDPKIRQPYTQSWNIGFQRELGPNRAFEVRYNGSRTIHQWIAQNINEVNIFENGFLPEFRNAQNNLAIYRAANPNCGTTGNPACNFGNSGLPGQLGLPIMTASHVSFTDSSFITNLTNGAAGAMAGTLTGRDYFCYMVGSAFSPCGNGYGTGAGYPINFWMANPYATGGWMGSPYMNDRGFANYNALQTEFRQRPVHGLAFTANYTWSKTLGVATAGDWMGGYRQNTIRNIKSSYGPANTDRNHVIHVNATYDLPFGKGKAFLNQGGVVDRVVGGWTLSTIYTFMTGAPFRVAGANQTFNNMLDGGVVLNGISTSDLQSHVGVYKSDTPGVVNYLDPTWVAQMKANGSIASNTNPGSFIPSIYLHGPHATFDDIGISKAVDITERVKFKFQTEMLNAFNHPAFQYSNANAYSSSFGRATTYSTTWYSPRRIEFRANLEF